MERACPSCKAAVHDTEADLCQECGAILPLPSAAADLTRYAKTEITKAPPGLLDKTVQLEPGILEKTTRSGVPIDDGVVVSVEETGKITAGEPARSAIPAAPVPPTPSFRPARPAAPAVPAPTPPPLVVGTPAPPPPIRNDEISVSIEVAPPPPRTVRAPPPLPEESGLELARPAPPAVPPERIDATGRLRARPAPRAKPSRGALAAVAAVAGVAIGAIVAKDRLAALVFPSATPAATPQIAFVPIATPITTRTQALLATPTSMATARPTAQPTEKPMEDPTPTLVVVRVTPPPIPARTPPPTPSATATLARVVENRVPRDPKHEAILVAWAKIQKNDIDGGVTDLKALLKKHDDYADAYYYLGVAYSLQGEDGKACKELRRYLELAPTGLFANTAKQSLTNC